MLEFVENIGFADPIQIGKTSTRAPRDKIERKISGVRKTTARRKDKNI